MFFRQFCILFGYLLSNVSLTLLHSDIISFLFLCLWKKLNSLNILKTKTGFSISWWASNTGSKWTEVSKVLIADFFDLFEKWHDFENWTLIIIRMNGEGEKKGRPIPSLRRLRSKRAPQLECRWSYDVCKGKAFDNGEHYFIYLINHQKSLASIRVFNLHPFCWPASIMPISLGRKFISEPKTLAKETWVLAHNKQALCYLCQKWKDLNPETVKRKVKKIEHNIGESKLIKQEHKNQEHDVWWYLRYLPLNQIAFLE